MSSEIEEIKKKPPIVLQCLYVSRGFQGKLSGSVEFKGEEAKTELKIGDELCRRIVELCAKALVEAAREIAEDLRSDCLMIDASK